MIDHYMIKKEAFHGHYVTHGNSVYKCTNNLWVKDEGIFYQGGPGYRCTKCNYLIFPLPDVMQSATMHDLMHNETKDL